jgi:hypothetical protein
VAGAYGADVLDLDLITATTDFAGPVLFDSLVNSSASHPELFTGSAPHAFFGTPKALMNAEVMELGAAGAEALGMQVEDRVCISITLCHAFGIGTGVGGVLNAGASVVLPAVGGISGCGVPSQRAAVTLEVLESTGATLILGDFHTLKAMPEAGTTDLSALRGGVIKCGSGLYMPVI